MNILVVDDDPFVLGITGQQVRGMGFSNVHLQSDPRLALEFVAGNVARVDLILLDLQMPDVDGIEFLRDLVHLHFTGAIVLISGEDERVLQTACKLAEAHRLNVFGALHKPVSADQLQSVVATISPRDTGTPRQWIRYTPERLAAAIDAGEVTHWYQPTIAMQTGTVAGVEALARWEHPTDGILVPSQFISMAEEHNLIDRLTRTTMSRVLDQVRQWSDAGIVLQVALNISMDCLSSLDLPDFLTRAARRAGVPIRRLTIEVTESRLMRNGVASLDILTRVRLKHIGLSIDDFGTGHSSLAQLRDVPFDELKIDRSFVEGVQSNAHSRAIVQASLSMAQQLGMRTVCEGVTTREEWDELRSMGCDLAQGYFIGKPMPAAEFGCWLAEWEGRRRTLLAPAERVWTAS